MSVQTSAGHTVKQAAYRVRVRLLVLVCCLITPFSSASAQRQEVCYTPTNRGLKELAPARKFLVLPAGSTRDWDAWDQEFWRHAEKIVGTMNAEFEADTATDKQPYNMYVGSYRGMRRVSGTTHAAVIICEEGKRGVCRGRSFWAIPSVKPEDLAKLAIERTIAAVPQLPICKLRDPNHRDKWIVPKDEQ